MSERLSMRNRFPSPSRPLKEIAPNVAPGKLMLANFPVGLPVVVLYPAAASSEDPPVRPARLLRIHGLLIPYEIRNSLNAVLLMVVVPFARALRSGPPKV